MLNFNLKTERLLLRTITLDDIEMLWPYVSDPEISEMLSGTESSQQKCESLVNLALQKGGKDNITVVLADYRIPT